MSTTLVLTFHLPLSSQPNSAAGSSVLHTLDGWTLTVRKGGSDRSINVSLKTVKVSLSTSHYSAFCAAFQGGSGNKTATVVHANGIVESFGWQGASTIHLPDAGSFAPIAAAMAAEAADAQQDSSRMS